MNRILLPVAFLYQGALAFRHKLYDWHILPSKRYDPPVICVGNLALGGTGKTPHTEYLVRMLSEQYSVCVVSRGYGRRTKGFQLVTGTCSADTVGDEPLQLFNKGKDLQVAVDENRCEAIELMMSQAMPPQVYVLDDAFQYRRLRAGLNLLLTAYGKLYSEDYLVPAGTLRDVRSASRRADIVVVSQCPESLRTATPEAYSTLKNSLRERLRLNDRQQLFLSSMQYEPLRPVNHAARDYCHETGSLPGPDTPCRGFAGIAHPEPFFAHLGGLFSQVETLRFPDHHRYKDKDLQRILSGTESAGTPRILVTTEKDVARLTNSPYFCQFDAVPLFAAPISVCVYEEESFNEAILTYVRKNSLHG